MHLRISQSHAQSLTWPSTQHRSFAMQVLQCPAEQRISRAAHLLGGPAVGHASLGHPARGLQQLYGSSALALALRRALLTLTSPAIATIITVSTKAALIATKVACVVVIIVTTCSHMCTIAPGSAVLLALQRCACGCLLLHPEAADGHVVQAKGLGQPGHLRSRQAGRTGMSLTLGPACRHSLFQVAGIARHVVLPASCCCQGIGALYPAPAQVCRAGCRQAGSGANAGRSHHMWP